jgi:uncharacterized protein YjiS (DUF1127 family)
MEMFSQRSLYEVHGIITSTRRRSRWAAVARRAITWLLALLKRAKAAIEAELAVRSTIKELTRMNDHMLRDLGLSRDELQAGLRRPRDNIATGDEPSA